MSGDPVTMYMIASAATKAVGTYSEIQNEKAQMKIRKQMYEDEIKVANLKAEQESNDRKQMQIEQEEHNLTVMSGSGFDPSSGSFQNIQYMTKKIADKDIANIRLNSAISVNKMSLQYQADKSASKAKVFGGYVSLVGTGISTKAKYDKYKKPKTWKGVKV